MIQRHQILIAFFTVTANVIASVRIGFFPAFHAGHEQSDLFGPVAYRADSFFIAGFDGAVDSGQLSADVHNHVFPA